MKCFGRERQECIFKSLLNTVNLSWFLDMITTIIILSKAFQAWVGMEGRILGDRQSTQGEVGKGMLIPFAEASTFSLETIRFIDANKAQGPGQYSFPTYI